MKKAIIKISFFLGLSIFIASCSSSQDNEVTQSGTIIETETSIDYNSATEESIEDLEKQITEEKTNMPAKIDPVLQTTPAAPATEEKIKDSSDVTDALDETTQEIDSIINEIMGEDNL